MKLMVIDGNSILNRAYYGIRPLTTRDGLYTHAVFGFFTTLLRLREEEKPDALCVTFDLHAPTFRHTADKAYKATRKPMPEELRVQVPVLKEALDALRIPRYELEGWEADDLIGTISRKCEADGWECVVVTGDKDSLQLITDQTKVKLVSTRMGQTTTKDMTRSAFREQYGFDPIHMIDLKALMGDSSDNIPGVPGVGEKTAMDLIQKYGSIETIYEKMPDVEAKPAALKKLAAGEESARHSYWLATIVTDAPLDFRPEDNLVRSPGPEAYPLFLRLEFTKLIEKFGLKAENAAQASAEKPSDFTVTVEQVTEPQQAETLLKLWRKADHVSLLALPDLTGVSVVCRTGETAAVTAELFFNKYQGDWNALLRALFSGDIKKVSHNVKDLMGLLLKNDLPADGFVFDTALAAYLLDATAGSYDLQRLYVAYYNTELPKPLYLEQDAFSLLGDTAAAEASFDSYATAVDGLYETLAPKLREKDLWDLFQTAELPLCRVLAEMERTGWPGGQGCPGVLRRDALRPDCSEGEGHLRYGRRGIQHQLSQAIGRDPVRQAGPAPREKNENRLVHQRRRTGEAPLRGSHCGGGAGVPPVCQAEVHLCRRSPEGNGRRWPGPHLLPDDGDCHRAAFFHGAQPPEHPHPDRPGQRDPEDVHSR